MRLKRRTVLFGLASFSLLLIATSCTNKAFNSTTGSSQAISDTASPASATTIRIGYQKATELDLLRSRGNLDKQIKFLGGDVQWSLFSSGPPMLEAMNAGKSDFGGVGESPPIFSQAAGGQFYYVSETPLSPQSQDIVVLKSSSIRTPADLKGKRVALQKGSSAHYLLLKVLEENGIAAKEVAVVSLSPADARAAFEQGNVDAWSIWDPFLAVAQTNSNVRGLGVGRQRRNYFLASRQFATEHPDSLKTVLAEAKQNGAWAKQNSKAIALKFSKEVKVEASILDKVYQRRSWEVLPVDDKIQKAQQQVADLFSKSQIIPKSIQVKESFLSSEEYAKIFPSSSLTLGTVK